MWFHLCSNPWELGGVAAMKEIQMRVNGSSPKVPASDQGPVGMSDSKWMDSARGAALPGSCGTNDPSPVSAQVSCLTCFKGDSRPPVVCCREREFAWLERE